MIYVVGNLVESLEYCKANKLKLRVDKLAPIHTATWTFHRGRLTPVRGSTSAAEAGMVVLPSSALWSARAESLVKLFTYLGGTNVTYVTEISPTKVLQSPGDSVE